VAGVRSAAIGNGRSDRSRAGSRPHQFERAYWESGSDWAYADAARRGSSHLKLPKVLDFFTGNIGFHHVHHLNARIPRIPNYDLALAHRENTTFHNVPTLSLWDALRALRPKLRAEDLTRLVTFAQARKALALASRAGPRTSQSKARVLGRASPKHAHARLDGGVPAGHRGSGGRLRLNSFALLEHQPVVVQ
jgi:hypothetical protein